MVNTEDGRTDPIRYKEKVEGKKDLSEVAREHAKVIQSSRRLSNTTSGSFWGGGEQDNGECVQMGTWFLLGLMPMSWNWIVVMVVEPCEYTKTH